MALRLSNWRAFLSQRKLTFAALSSTLLVFIILIGSVPSDAKNLQNWYAISPSQIELLYLALLIILLLTCVFEPLIRLELADGKGAALIIGAASFLSFFLFQTILPKQEDRLFYFAPSLWLISCHLILLFCLTVLMVIEQPWNIASKRLRRYATIITIALIISILVAHILSVGKFMLIDLPDEPWFASIATNVASTGQINPSAVPLGAVVGNAYYSRYYVVMGLWTRIFGSTFETLRLFPLLVAGLGVLLFAIILLRLPDLNVLQKTVGIAVMLGLSPLVRMSHHLRMDAGLAVYGSIVLVGLVAYFQNEYRPKRWLVLIGIAHYIGLETIPTAAAPLGIAIGIVLCVSSLRWPLSHTKWQHIVVYLGASLGALLIFIIVHFAPDFATGFAQYRSGLSFYQGQISNLIRNPFTFNNMFIRFSIALSPIEIIVFLLLVVLALYFGSVADRLILAIASLALFLLMVIPTSTYGYVTVFTPFAAYLAARLCRRQVDVSIGVFVLLPALLSPPIHDMLASNQLNLNQRDLNETSLLTWQIPEETNVIGEDIFWFTLHNNRHFIMWSGFSHYTWSSNLGEREALEALNIDVGICEEGTPTCRILEDSGLFASPTRFDVTRKYLVYRKRH